MHSKNGRFVSDLDGFTVHFDQFKQDKYGRTDRARAEAEMRAHENALRKAAQLRAGRPVSDNEIKTGVLANRDLRTVRERHEDETQHHSVNNREPGKPDPYANPYSGEVERLEQKLSRTWRESDKRAVQNRLDLARQNAQQRQEVIERRREFDENMRRPELTVAFAEAKFYANLLRNSPKPEDQEALAIVIQAERDLIQSADADAWKAQLNLALADRKAKQLEITKALEAEITSLQEDLTARVDMTPTEEPTE